MFLDDVVAEVFEKVCTPGERAFLATSTTSQLRAEEKTRPFSNPVPVTFDSLPGSIDR